MSQPYRTVFTAFVENPADSIAFKVLGDHTTQRIQARISLEHFGNASRQARKNQSRVTFGHFGVDSEEASILGSEAAEQSAKRKQLLLDNALRLGHLPRPHGPR